MSEWSPQATWKEGLMTDRTLLITGATGKQGGATIRHLDGSDFRLRAMTRRPHSEAARDLKNRGVDVVEGDLDDEESLKRALEGAWGVYAVQNTWEAGVENEETQGPREAGVEHFVYASVGSAHRKTGIPHFDNKARVEEAVRTSGFPSHVIIRPVFFMENLPTPWFLNGDAIYAAMKPSTVLQMIAVDDIGKYGARAFTDPKLKGRAVDIAGDAVTMPEAAAVLSEALGRAISFVEVPIADVRKNSEDFAIMLEWFGDTGYDVDIPADHAQARGRRSRASLIAGRSRRRMLMAA
jgi:uncharacterized protein YbjT (DUF2867 family)